MRLISGFLFVVGLAGYVWHESGSHIYINPVGVEYHRSFANGGVATGANQVSIIIPEGGYPRTANQVVTIGLDGTPINVNSYGAGGGGASTFSGNTFSGNSTSITYR